MDNILILGGTGRFGKILAESLPNYKITTLARNKYADISCDINSFTDYTGYDIVINCAAMKDVAKCEEQVDACIDINITGTKTSLNYAAKCGVKRYIYISTDMAVDVYSVYGASKKIADSLVVNSAKTTQMQSCVVRLGNIIGGYGSILTALAAKAEELGYAPITHPDMTRFFMSVTECANFVLSIIESKEEYKGYIFAPNCKSYRIMDVAKAVAPNVPTKIIGLRPGDALAITMISEAEMLRTTLTERGDFLIIPSWSREVITPININMLTKLTSANNPKVATVAELKELYKGTSKN